MSELKQHHADILAERQKELKRVRGRLFAEIRALSRKIDGLDRKHQDGADAVYILERMMPSLVIAGALLVVSLFAIRRATANANALHARLMAEADAEFQPMLAEAQAQLAAARLADSKPDPSRTESRFRLELVVTLPADVASVDAVFDRVGKLVSVVSKYDRALGGAGFWVDEASSGVRSGSSVALVLVPNDADDADGRLRKVAELFATSAKGMVSERTAAVVRLIETDRPATPVVELVA